MRKNDDLKLRVISDIDEKIIDEATDTRTVLSERLRVAARKARKRFIAIGSLAASFALVAAMLLFVILPLILPMTRNIPVYQGMTVRRMSSTPTIAQGSAEYIPLSYRFAERQTRKSSLQKDIKDVVDFDVKNNDEVKYYVEPNETFIIEIHISNPKDYEIQSFTLNGKKYANYMFKEGSTMELLLLEVTAPASSGYVDYTIDAIKYIDGTEIKDVDMSSGNKSVKVGVAYPTAPSATVTSQTVSTTTLNLSIRVTDPYFLIGDNELSFYLFDGERIVDKKPLRVGDNTVVLNNLIMSQTYEYGVVTAFDMADGKDTHKEWLLTDKITTLGAYTISNAAATQNSISFDVGRIGEIGTVTSISLYDATTNELVQKAGPDTRSFENLLSNHTYHVYVEFSYPVNGLEMTDRVVVTGIKTAAKAEPTLAFDAASADKTTVTYGIAVTDPNGVLKSTKVELLWGNERVRENSTHLNGTFEGLLSNTKYTVKVNYTYDLNDGQGAITEYITKEIVTVAKVAPILTFATASSDKISVTYGVNVMDTDDLLNVTKVELLKGNEAVRVNGTLLNGTFDGLLSNTQYTVKVSYTYDLNDGNGTIAAFVTKEITTVAKVAPMLTIDHVDQTDTTVIGDIQRLDVDSVGAITSVDLYQNGILVQSNASKAINFSGLRYYTDYQIAVSYAFDLNDGMGTQIGTVTYDFKTTPHLAFAGFTVINTSAVSEGETIFLQINIENPNGVVYQTIVINGKEYPVVKNSSTATMLVCEILNNGQFEGGDTVLMIEKVIAELDGATYHILPQSNYTASVFINGRLQVTELRAVVEQNGGYIQRDYVFPSDTAYLELVLSNKTGYHIDSVTINSQLYTSLIRLDDDRYLVEIPFSTGRNHFDLTSVTYSRESLNKTVAVQIKSNVLKLETDEIQYVSAADDLLHMNNGFQYYELTNNIDLSGLEWRGGDFCGVFNGKGYAIQNMSFVGTENGDANIGLFAIATGIIQNLRLERTMLVIAVGEDAIEGAAIVCGGIVAQGVHLIIENCFVDESSLVSSVGTVGGIAGRIEFGVIRNCTSNAAVNGGEMAGGIAGRADGTPITNCVNNGAITVVQDYWVGGIVGRSDGYVAYCMNNGVIQEAHPGFGSIVGTVDKSMILNCVSSKGYKLYSSCFGDDPVLNSYLLNQNATAEQLSTKAFYTDVLHFSEEIWNLDDLDIANGKYPRLR